MLTRISDDKAGEERGVARQEQDCRALAKRLGWGIGEIVIENDTSAFKRRRVTLPDGSKVMRVVRPGFRRILEMLESGNADGLIAYDLDRVARDPRDLEDLIDVVEQRKIPVESVTGSLRLGSDGDVTSARILVAVANKASRDTSRRVTRKQQELAEEGKPGGGGYRGFGYSTDGLEVIEEEAEVIRDIARMVLEDMSLVAIAKNLTERGIPTVRGLGPWHGRTVWGIVSKPKVAGLRVYRGEIVGNGVWPAILDRQTWEDVLAKLDERKSGHTPGLKHWLNQVFYCSQCKHPLKACMGNRAMRYWCSTTVGGCGKIAINAAHSEAEISRQVIEMLTQPRVLEQLRTASNSDSLAQARADLAADEKQLLELSEAYAKRLLTFPEFMAARKIIDGRVKEARALVSSSAPKVLRKLLEGDVAEQWEKLPAAEKRSAVLALVPDGFEILPFEKGVPGRFDPTRIQPRSA